MSVSAELEPKTYSLHTFVFFSNCQKWVLPRASRVRIKFGGRERIRTSGTVTRTPDFESGAFNHSATLPANAADVLCLIWQ